MRTRSQSRNNFPQQEASPAIVEPLRIELLFLKDQFQEDPPEDPPEGSMADNRTMAEFLQAPTEGYEDAIVIPEIAANNFELKHGLINLVQNKHQDAIASLQKCIQEEEKEPKSPGTSSSSNSEGGDVLCYICGKNGHKAKECCGVGCNVCGKVGHDGWGCNEDRLRDGRVGTNGAICYHCGKAGISLFVPSVATLGMWRARICLPSYVVFRYSIEMVRSGPTRHNRRVFCKTGPRTECNEKHGPRTGPKYVRSGSVGPVRFAHPYVAVCISANFTTTTTYPIHRGGIWGAANCIDLLESE
nr:DNA-binding protein HEXBP [Tanacetum cinerariifolium]